MFNFFSQSPLKIQTKKLQEQVSELENKLEEQYDEYMDYYDSSKSLTDQTGSDPISGQFSLLDEQYDKAMLQKLFMTEGWFYIAVSTVAETIAALPFKLEKKKIIKQNIQHINGDVEQVYKETWVDAGAEPEAQIFKMPNEIQTPFDFWYNIVADLLATGDAYVYPHKTDLEPIGSSEERLRNAMSRVRKTDIDGLFRINSAATEIVPSTEEGEFLEGYVVAANEQAIGFEPDELIHMKLPNPSDPFYGLAKVVPVMKKVLLDRYTDEHHMRFYKQGARLGGVIETSKKLTKEQMHRLTSTFESKFTGKRQHHKTLILPEGMKYNTIEVSPVDSSLIEFSKVNKEAILAAYKVPPIKVGLLDGSSYANALIQNKTYYQNAVQPITTLIEQSINQSTTILKPTRNLRFRFDYSQVEALQADLKDKATAAKEMLAAGLTFNEVREKVWGAGPIVGGEITPSMTAPNPMTTLSTEPLEQKEVTNQQNDTEALPDIMLTESTFETRVAQLINQALAEGINLELATTGAIQQALAEGFQPVNESESIEEQKDSHHTHIDSKGVATGPAVDDESGLHHHIQYDEDKNPVGLTSSEEEGKTHTHLDIYEERTSGPRGGKFYQSQGSAPFSKEALSAYAKTLNGSNVDEMVKERAQEVFGFFKRLEAFIMNKSHKKAYRVGNSFNIKMTIPSITEFKTFINKEANNIAESQLKAAHHGYKNNIPTKSITFPNEEALSILKKNAVKNVKSVTKSSLGQLKNIITSSASEQVSVTEVRSRIQDAFDTMPQSKAETIARTETLSAVSIGQDMKRADFQKKFPKEAGLLKRVWITAEDDKVRDSHAAQDNMVREAGKSFPNGLKFPRDPSGEADEVINCRCSFVDFLPEDKDSILSILG